VVKASPANPDDEKRFPFYALLALFEVILTPKNQRELYALEGVREWKKKK